VPGVAPDRWSDVMNDGWICNHFVISPAAWAA